MSLWNSFSALFTVSMWCYAQALDADSAAVPRSGRAAELNSLSFVRFSVAAFHLEVLESSDLSFFSFVRVYQMGFLFAGTGLHIHSPLPLFQLVFETTKFFSAMNWPVETSLHIHTGSSMPLYLCCVCLLWATSGQDAASSWPRVHRISDIHKTQNTFDC